MTFINTDGMSFFGPGSEWFWTMLQFTALAITFYAIYRQLRAQQVQVGENAKLLRSQAHDNALMLDQRPHEYQTTFDEPFHSDVAGEFAKKAGSPPVA